MRRTARSCPTTFPRSCRSKSSTSELRNSGSNNPSAEMYGLTIAIYLLRNFQDTCHHLTFHAQIRLLSVGAGGSCGGVVLGLLARIFYGLQVKLLVVPDDLGGAEIAQRVLPCRPAHFVAQLCVFDQFETGIGHSCHITDTQKEPILLVFNDLGKPANFRCNDRDFARHRLQSHKAKRFVFARKQQDVGNRKKWRHFILFPEEKHILRNALGIRQPLRFWTFRAIANQKQLCRALLANTCKDAYNVLNALDRSEV